MNSELFDASSTRLQPGINLIEASAGTGKTYTIAMLVLRFVAEQGMDIKSLLVVTFTKAATEELKARIVDRLSEARRALHDSSTVQDDTLKVWLQGLEPEPELIRQRLNQALLDIDQACIFTIHGFCQRVLAEHALESGQLFDCELTGDIRSIRQGCSDDYWRRVVYPLTAWEASIICSGFHTPDALLSSVDYVDPEQPVFPEPQDNEILLSQLNRLTQKLASEIDGLITAITQALTSGKFKASYVEALSANMDAYASWLQRKSLVMPDCSLLGSAGLINGLNGNKFRKSKANPLPAQEQKAQFIAALGVDFQTVDELLKIIASLRLNLRRGLLQVLHQQMSQTLLQLNLLSFDDLISRLSDAVQGENSHVLITALQQRYQVALIDEFQDTDHKQWRIFSSLFSSDNQSLFLIGDPKQAIYKFRGADIFSYFGARDSATRHYTLGYNWRSHPALVAGVNTLFARENPFYFQQLAFNPVQAARREDDGVFCYRGKPQPPFLLWQLEEKAENGCWSVRDLAQIKETTRHAIVAEIIELLKGVCTIRFDAKECVLQPRDIAILVRSNRQAKAYQRALSEAKVPSVLNSKESVFASAEAADLLLLLSAVAQPGQINLLKQALSLDWFGLDGQQLYALIEDEVKLDDWVGRFQSYFLQWQQHGMLTMLQALLRHEQVSQRIAVVPEAERILTNLQHLGELIQQAVIDQHLGIQKTLDWLRQAITEAVTEGGAAGDEQQLRLESDEDAVRIITMHSAKGLEYPVVFCPALWHRDTRLQQEKYRVVCHENGGMVADLGSDQFEQRRAQALDEELAEDLRLLYVAVTRARYRCYINWADVRSYNKMTKSALAYLLQLEELDFADQQSLLQRLCERQPEVFSYRMLESVKAEPGSYRAHHESSELQHRQRHRSLYSHWQMSSYTALSGLSFDEAPELPQDKADEPDINPDVEQDAEQLPKGAHTGNVLHDLLEHLSFTALAYGEDFAAQRDAACIRYGLQLERPQLIGDLLRRVVTTPLAADPEFCLCQIAESDCVKEMPFYLSVQTMDVAEINSILAHSPTVQALGKRQMSGFLTGFIDLVCCYQGRYYLIDYKSNDLPAYGREQLVEAMREHNYGLQYWLYALVLHRYLQRCLADYDYQTHFGGVKYLFVRGMQPSEPESGVFTDKPDLAAVQKLEQLFFRS